MLFGLSLALWFLGLGLVLVAWGAEPSQVGEAVVVAACVVVTLGADAVARADVPAWFAVDADAFAHALCSGLGLCSELGPVGW